YAAPAGERMRSTQAKVQEALGRGSLVYRYGFQTEDGLSPGEGTFTVCGFWAVQCLVQSGDVEEGRRMFEALLRYGNDVGLFSEEIDPASGAALGNFPQVFTHVGVINAALALAAA